MYNDEELKIAKIKDFSDESDDFYKHEEYERDPEGCGFPICVLIDARPKRFRSLCQFIKYIKEESLHFRMFHIQKGDCTAASKSEKKPIQTAGSRIFCS